MTSTNQGFKELRNMLENVYVVNQNGELFRIQDLTIHDKSLLSDEFQESEPGTVLRRMKSGEWQEFIIPEDMIDTMTNDPEITDYLNKVVVDNCTEKIMYEVAWWAMGFNKFSYAFTRRGLQYQGNS